MTAPEIIRELLTLVVDEGLVLPVDLQISLVELGFLQPDGFTVINPS